MTPILSSFSGLSNRAYSSNKGVVLPTVTGGNFFGLASYKFNQFDGVSGTLVVSNAPITVEYVIVAGGGGGGAGTSAASPNINGAGGGGGGGEVKIGSITLLPNTYSIVVGAGGLFGSNTQAPTSGGNSSAFGITAIGGGPGASGNSTLPRLAGSGGAGGGGAARSGYTAAGTGITSNNNGGAGAFSSNTSAASGGGGGAGGPGVAGTLSPLKAGNGGAGVKIWTDVYTNFFAGGGGGGGGRSTLIAIGTAVDGGGNGGNGAGNGFSGTSGGGGGGGGTSSSSAFRGGSGGAGFVVIRYPSSAAT